MGGSREHGEPHRASNSGAMDSLYIYGACRVVAGGVVASDLGRAYLKNKSGINPSAIISPPSPSATLAPV